VAVTVDDLRRQVNAGADHNASLEQCLAFAEAVVNTYTERVPAGRIPEAVLDEAVLTAASDQFHRRKAPNGVLSQAFTGPGGEPVPARISRDPFAAIRPILRPWVGGGLRSVGKVGERW
jgi:hypothetical protein